jgi:hypothetical protein
MLQGTNQPWATTSRLNPTLLIGIFARFTIGIVNGDLCEKTVGVTTAVGTTVVGVL